MNRLLFTLILLLLPFSGFSQNKIDLRIDVTKDKSFSGKSNGEKQIQYLNYRLFDILSELTSISKKNFVIKNNSQTKNQNVDLIAKSNETLKNDPLIEEVFKMLKEKYGISVSIRKQLREAELLKVDYETFKECKGDPEGQNFTITNVLFEGNCIGLKHVKNLIQKWYGKDVHYNKRYKGLNFNVSIKKSESWETFTLDMAYKYGIIITQSQQEIPVLHIE